nr:DUF1349 domain-containing protein [Actinomycetales bacterium]
MTVRIPWSSGRWTSPPSEFTEVGDDLDVTCAPYSDAWRTTSYGFVHDTENALVAPFVHGSAVEVVFTADFSEQFDQAGLFLVAGPETWVKAGVELSDGMLQLGAVVTHGVSDWSVSPVPEWRGERVRVRASWSEDAVTVRAGLDGGDVRFVRVLPWRPDLVTEAGPLACSPTRGVEARLTVRFHEWSTEPADTSLHP